MKIEADIILCKDHAQRVPLVMSGHYTQDELASSVLHCSNCDQCKKDSNGKNCMIEKVEGLLQARCVQEAGK